MQQPIQLPSGKTIDLSRCIAIIPPTSLSTTDGEIILADTDRQIPIDTADFQVLRQQLTDDRRQPNSLRSIDPDLLSPAGKALREQEISEKLKEFNAKWQKIAMQADAEETWEAFKKIVDDERTSGQKLYSLE